MTGARQPLADTDAQDDLATSRTLNTVNAPADIGSVQAVIVDMQTGKQYGGADSRREGKVIGLPRPQGSK